MGVVVGYGSSFSIAGGCAINASWGGNPNVQYLFCLDGNVNSAYKNISKPTETVNATVYSGGTSPVSVTASTTCEDTPETVTVASTLNSCGAGGTAGGPSGPFIPTSFSFNKQDSILPGQESWSAMRYVGENLPTHVMVGIGQGSTTEGETGVQLSANAAGGNYTATTGSVSVGAVGRADTMSMGVVSIIGGSSLGDGDTGAANASIPYIPIYI